MVSKKKTSKEIFSVKELKALLAGIDMFNGSKDWVPDKAQWARIRQKIDQMNDSTMPFQNVDVDEFAEREHPEPSFPVRQVRRVAPSLPTDDGLTVVAQPPVREAAIITPTPPSEDPALERIRQNLQNNVKNRIPIIGSSQPAGQPIIPPMSNPGANPVIVQPVTSPDKSEFV